MGEVSLYVGENLSYEEERILVKKAWELTDYDGHALSVVCAVNKQAKQAFATHGLPDESFIRGKAPMTKEEVRCVSLFKLQLHQDSVCYDVGAGTGSVSVEMALRANQGQVFAIEKKKRRQRFWQKINENLQWIIWKSLKERHPLPWKNCLLLHMLLSEALPVI